MSVADLVVTEFRNVNLDSTLRGWEKAGSVADNAEHKFLDLTEAVKKPAQEAKGVWLLEKAIEDLGKEIDKTSQKADKFDMPRLDKNGRLRDANGRFLPGGGSGGSGGGADDLGERIEQQGRRAERGTKDMQMAVMNLGQGAANAGIFFEQNTERLRAFNQEAATAANEGERADNMLSAMMTKRGEGGQVQEISEALSKLSMDAAMTDDDPLKMAAAGLEGFGMTGKQVIGIMDGLIGQTRLYNNGIADTATLTATAEAVGRAFGKGDVGGLSRIGVTLSDEQIAKINELKDSGASQAEKQAAMYAILQESFNKYALSMTQGMSEAEIRANRLENQLDGVNTAFGQGVNAAQRGMQDRFASLVTMGGDHPELLKGAGEVSGYAQMIGGALGPLLTGGAAAAQLAMGWKALRSEGGGLRGMLGGLRGTAEETAKSKSLLAEVTNLDAKAEQNKTGIAGLEAAALEKVGDAATGAAADKAVLGAETEAVAGKMGLLQRAASFLDSPLSIGGRGASALESGGLLGRMGTLGSMGGEGAAITGAGALASLGLGAFAGFQASSDMQSAGFSQGQSYMYGAATGIGAAGAAMFLPGGAVAVALGEAAALGINKLYNEPMERAAEQGTGADNADLYGADMGGRMAQANQAGDREARAKLYDEMSRKAGESGDSVMQQRYALEAASQRSIAGKENVYGSDEWRAKIQAERNDPAYRANMTQLGVNGPVNTYTPSQQAAAQAAAQGSGRYVNGAIEISISKIRVEDPVGQAARQQANNRVRGAYG